MVISSYITGKKQPTKDGGNGARGPTIDSDWNGLSGHEVHLSHLRLPEKIVL